MSTDRPAWGGGGGAGLRLGSSDDTQPNVDPRLKPKKKKRGSASQEDIAQLQALLFSLQPKNPGVRLATPEPQQPPGLSSGWCETAAESGDESEQPELLREEAGPLASQSLTEPASEFELPLEASSSMRDLHAALSKEDSMEEPSVPELHGMEPGAQEVNGAGNFDEEDCSRRSSNSYARASGLQLFEELNKRSNPNSATTSFDRLPEHQDASFKPSVSMVREDRNEVNSPKAASPPPAQHQYQQFVATATQPRGESNRMEDSAFGEKRLPLQTKSSGMAFISEAQSTRPQFLDCLQSRKVNNAFGDSIPGSRQSGKLHLEDISDTQETELFEQHQMPLIRRSPDDGHRSGEKKAPAVIRLRSAVHEIDEIPEDQGNILASTPPAITVVPKQSPHEPDAELKDLQIQKHVDFEAQHPDLRMAEEVRAELTWHHSLHNVWGTPPQLLSEFGEGIILYLWSLQCITILLLVMAFLHVPAIYIFAASGYDSNSFVSLGTLAGFGPVWDPESVNVTFDDVNAYYGMSAGPGIETLSMEALEDLRTRSRWWKAGTLEDRHALSLTVFGNQETSKAKLLEVVAAMEVCIALVIFASSCLFRYQMKRLQQKMDSHKPVIANYSIMVTGLPPNTAKLDLEHHFGRWGSVHSIEIIYNDSWIYSELEARGRMVLQAEQEVNLTMVQMGMEYHDQMKAQWLSYVDSSSSEFLQHIRQNLALRTPVCAFVMFTSVDEATAAAGAYLKSQNVVSRVIRQPEHLRINGSSIKVNAAPEPTNVIWPSLECNWASKAARRAGTCITIAVLLAVAWLVTIALISSVVPAGPWARSAGLQQADCSAALWSSCGAPSDDLAVLAIEWEPSSDTVAKWQMCAAQEGSQLSSGCPGQGQENCLSCYCAFVTFRDRHLCPSHTGGSAVLRRVIVVLSVLATNAIIQALCPALVRQEAQNTHTQQRMALASKLTLALAASTILIPIFSNIAPSWPWGSAGRYPDMSPAWVRGVGLDMFAIVSCLLACGAVRLVGLHIRMKWREKRIWTALTQAQLNSVIIGPEFDMPHRLGVHLSILVVVLIFSGVVPILCLVGIAYFAIVYVVDKISILRICSMPPIYSAQVLHIIHVSAKLCVFGRLLVSAWAMSFYHTGSLSSKGSTILYNVMHGLWHVASPASLSQAFFAERGVQAVAAPLVITAMLLALLLLLALVITVFMSIAGLRWPTQSSTAKVVPLLFDLEDGVKINGDGEGRSGWSSGSARIAGPKTYGNFRNSIAYATPHTTALLQAMVLKDKHQQNSSVPITTELGIQHDFILALPWKDVGPHKAQGRPGQLPRKGSETIKVALPPEGHKHHTGLLSTQSASSSDTGIFGALFETLIGL